MEPQTIKTEQNKISKPVKWIAISAFIVLAGMVILMFAFPNRLNGMLPFFIGGLIMFVGFIIYYGQADNSLTMPTGVTLTPQQKNPMDHNLVGTPAYLANLGRKYY